MNTKQRLEAHVRGIASDITSGSYDFEPNDEPCAQDYLNDVLDIEYIIGSDREYRGARVLVAYGGPNIYIDTKSNIVEGYWGLYSVTASYTDTLGLNEWLEELYECTK